MIKNERQYRITKSQVDKFAETLAEFDRQSKTSNIPPLILKAQREAVESQLEDLRRQIQEYDELRTGNPPLFKLRSIEELPEVLIKTRIALGLSQKDLAERIGVPEQQVQRYEATDYESASVARVKEIIKALNIAVEENLRLPDERITTRDFFKRMSKAGLDRDFIMKRLLSPSLAARFESKDAAPDLLGFQAAAHVGRIFGWKPEDVFGSNPLVLDTAPIAQVRFKVSRRTNQVKLHVFTLYARYMAMLLAQATGRLPRRNPPTDPYQFRQAILSAYGSITLENLVRYIWRLGIPVIVLDPGSFHAACFRDNGRSIIVLTQKISSEARWMFNLLHEFYHAAQGIEQMAETEEELRQSDEERIASQFADIVLMGKEPHGLAERCLEEANWDIPQLKRVVQKVANEEGVRIDVLANYLAYRISSEQNVNWWGTAESLQKPLVEARTIIRNIMLEYADFSVLAEPDLELLKQTLRADEVIVNG